MPLIDRRTFLSMTSQLGLASTLFPGALYTVAAQAQQPADEPVKIPPEMVAAAAALAGITISPEHVQMMLDGLNDQRTDYARLRRLHLPNSAPPAYLFDPLPPGASVETQKKPPIYSTAVATMPANLEDLAFATISELADLVRRRKISATNLTEMYLSRLQKYDSLLHFVVTLTEERARTQAREADREIAAGRYRRPLHGLPWGAKDLLAVKGYRTTWGAGGLEQQSFDYDATVVQRLDAAGAVLLAKTTMGALAMGDTWFGGRTRSPWNAKQGSSGSSAGSASATGAGCVAFAIGSETLGSIASPATRCGVTGLRPTFGAVPRTGAMTLSWTMDKIGPICRAVEDCAIVFETIHGPDGEDRTVRHAAFNWDAHFDWRSLRVGYFSQDFEAAKTVSRQDDKMPLTEEEKKQRNLAAAAQAREDYDRRYDQATLEKLRAMGVPLIPLSLPDLPYGAMSSLLTTEAAAAFDDWTLTGRDALLTEQSSDDWPNLFRMHRFQPAVEYIQANRARMLAILEFAKLFEQVDVIVAPTYSKQLTATNLTGHPAVILPNGLRGADAPTPLPVDPNPVGGPGTPVSITFLGGLYQEAKLCAFARAYQQATGFEKLRPQLG